MLKFLVATLLQREFDGLQITTRQLLATTASSAHHIMMMVMGVIDGGDFKHRVVIGEIHTVNDFQTLQELKRSIHGRQIDSQLSLESAV